LKLRRLYAHARNEPGQAVVEMALVLPILMLVILGIMKFGILYNNYLQLTDAVRSGARQYAVERSQATPCIDSAQAIVNAAGGLGTNNITGSISEEGLSWQFSVSGATPSQTGTTNCAGTQTNGAVYPSSGDAATVSASYPCDLNIFGISIAPGCRLTASATERVE